MPQAITFPFLASVNDGVSLAYLRGLLGGAPSVYSEFCFDASSTGSEEIYPMLAGLRGLREWVGDRVVNGLSLSTFRIANKSFEETISVARPNLEDDKYGMLTPAAQELGQDAKDLPDLLTAALMKNGHTALTFDGQNFFDTAHPNYTSTGAGTTVPNYVTGSGPSWYLLDTSRPSIRGFIYQRRRPYVIVPKFSLTDPSVFFDNEYVWGVDGRSNAGYGLWHFAFRSDAALNLANLESARAQMASLRRPNGAPMGIGAARTLKLVVPTALYPLAKGYCENQFDPGQPSNLTPNTFRGMATALENNWLN